MFSSQFHFTPILTVSVERSFPRSSIVNMSKHVVNYQSHLVLALRNYFGVTANSRQVRAFSVSSARSNGEQCSVRKLKIGVLGAPIDRGQPKHGVGGGPRVCRDSGFIDVLRNQVGQDLKDYGDISIPPNIKQDIAKGPKNLKDVAAVNKTLSDAVAQVLHDGRICLTLGGDHSLGIGTLHGASSVHNDLAVLWVDAHCDLNTPSTSYSGNMHGMSLSFVMKELVNYVKKYPEFAWITPRITASNLAYIGLRDVDPAERAFMNMLGVHAYSMKDVDLHGIRKVTQMALDRICPGRKRPLHVSYDIDALDANEVTTTGTPVPGGLTLREGVAIMEEVYQAGNLVSMDLVEVNPALGTAQEVAKTREAVKQLLIHAFGYHRAGIPTSAGQIPKLH